MNTDNTTIDSERLGITIPAPTRHQRRHARQTAAYKAAIAKQGTHYVIGLSRNPKGPRHVGAKQLAKLNKKRGLCEGCQKPASTASGDGYPLCEACSDELSPVSPGS